MCCAAGETLPEAEKTSYTVPYPVSVDAENSSVVLMFDAWSSGGELLYRGTDVMVVGEGLVRRIVTVNHATGTVYSAQSAL